MAAPFNPPTKGEEFQFDIQLEDAANPGKYKSNPTIAAGDFKISKDTGTFANLATLPTVTPAAGVNVHISLSATEMTADNVAIVWQDQTTLMEWPDGSMNIVTS